MPEFAISSAVVGRADASFTRHGAFVRTAGVVFWEMRPWCVVRTLDGGKQAAAANKVDTKKKERYFFRSYLLVLVNHRLFLNCSHFFTAILRFISLIVSKVF